MDKTSNIKATSVSAQSWLIEAVEKVNVVVIGCGGTGSQVLQGLARMNYALENLGHQGFHVTAFDPDIVTTANRGRQLFAESDIDSNKAGVCISKINRYYGYDWEFNPIYFTPKVHRDFRMDTIHSIYMTCADVVKPRHELLELLTSKAATNYWMDFGNAKDTGQVLLGDYGKGSKRDRLKGVEYYGIPEFDDPDVPSCSLAESLQKQDLMINTMVANTGMTMLWQAFTKLKFEYNASFINLKSMQIKSTLNYEN